MSRYEGLTLEIDSYVATVNLNRPPVNACSTEFYEAIADAFHEIDRRSDDVRAAILTATGKYFSVGRDLKSGGDYPPERKFAAVRAATGSIFHCGVPVVCAVNGPALGGGFGLVLHCDIIVACAGTTFGWPEINVGLIGGMASSNRALTPYVSRKLYFTGERISAEELQQHGVVDSVHEPEELLPAARRIASLIASKSPLAVRTAKWTANEVEKVRDFELAFRAIELRAAQLMGSTEDAKEAARAFAEKRVPVFKGF
jgi:enoyl-CoA hydratase